MSIGIRLKSIRSDFKLNQKEFAEKLDVSFRSYVYYEADSRAIPQEALLKLAQLGYSINWLLTGVGERFADNSSSPDNAMLKLSEEDRARILDLIERFSK